MADEKDSGKPPVEGQKLEKVYEMMWDCPYCGARKLLGKTHRHCPHCGAAQDPNARYFPPDSEKVAVQDHVYFGADWKCAACEAPNSNKADFCGNCGAPKDGAGAVKLAHEKKEEPSKLPATAPPPPPKEAKGGGKMKYVGCCLGLVVLASIALCASFFLLKKEDTVTVAGHTWARTIQVQEYQSLSKQDWCDAMPAGAHDVSSSRKQRDTKKVPDGEECTTKQVDNGDGTFREVEDCRTKYAEEPIFDEWCSYKLDAWATSRTAEAKGQDLSPTWPQANARTCPAPRLGCEQEGARNETYTVLLRDSGGETHECTFAEARWRSLADGAKLKAEMRVIGGGVDCDSLQ